MKDLIYITGHKNPDSDSICSAIGYADLKNRLGYNAVPGRLGEINRETEFILKKFNMDVPVLIPTVKTQVSDLDIDIPVSVSPDVTIKTAWMLMKKNNIKTLSVVDENEKLIGIATLSDITNKYMDALENNIIASSGTPLINIVETLNSKLIYGNQEIFNTSGKIVVAALSSDHMKNYVGSGDIVIVGNKTESQIAAIEYGANCLVVTGGCSVEDEVIDAAKAASCVIMTTPQDTFTTARIINQSIPVRHVMTTDNIISFDLDDFVDEIKDVMLKTRFRSYPVIDENKRVKGSISRYHLISQKKKKVILLDHNEKAQSVHGIEEAEILEIVDHHRVADIQTGKPIFFRNEPVGSTSTIVANMFFENGLRPSKGIAGVLCSAILSDTLKFKSPTCTFVDKITAERLAEIAGIDIDEYSMEMFRAGTSLQGKTPEEIFYQDYKDFTLGSLKIGIGQVNTMDTDNLGETKDELLRFMKQVCEKGNYNLVIILLTNIIKEGSELLYVGNDKELISKAFNVELGENSVYLPGVVSRKKQVVPPLSSAAE